MLIALLLLAGVDVVSGGAPRLRIETDGSPAARFAADLLQRHAVLMAGAALPETGTLPPLRLEADGGPGYEIRAEDRGLLVKGDVVRAAYDVLEEWGAVRRGDLSVEPRSWSPERELWWEADAFDPSVPATGFAVRGLGGAWGPAAGLSVPVRVASTTFDDFLPPDLFERHPEWFALREGRREPRGNFALTNAEARAFVLDRVGEWLEAHPEVDRLGLWPEVTTVWCEESAALGHAESYALLWREAAARFPSRRFEILATGLTLRPPEGPVPGNVEVRLRPGTDASALQGVAGQEIEESVRAWEAKGARVVLEIDAAPEPWCGMPWPCHDALRADARRFRAAVIRGGSHVHARIWRSPDAPADVDPALLERAKGVRSWGHPRDAADLFPGEEWGLAFRIAAMERLHRAAMREGDDPELRRSAAADAFLGYRELLRSMPPATAAVYRRYRARDFRRMLEELLPQGVERTVGPAKVRETFDRTEVETDTLRLGIDARSATVVSLRRHTAGGWSDDLAGDGGRCFAVVRVGRTEGREEPRIDFESPEPPLLHVTLGGRDHVSRLEIRGGSGRIRQVAEAPAPAALAVACRWKGAVFDRWICPAYAAEGRFEDDRDFPMPEGTLLYARKGERGPGLAARLPWGGLLSVRGGDSPMLLATGGAAVTVEWIVFTDAGELG